MSWRAHYHQILEDIQPSKIYTREFLTKTVSQLIAPADLELLMKLPTQKLTAEQRLNLNKTWRFSHETLRRAEKAGKLKSLDNNHPDLFRGEAIIRFVNAEMKVAA